MLNSTRCPRAAGNSTFRVVCTAALISGISIASMPAFAQGRTAEHALASGATAPIAAPVNRDGDCCGWDGRDK